MAMQFQNDDTDAPDEAGAQNRALLQQQFSEETLVSNNDLPDNSHTENDDINVAKAQKPTYFRKQSLLIPNDDRSNRTQDQRPVNYFYTTWLFEIVSFCAASAALAGVLVVLALYNGRPDPRWSGGLTLNTIVSVASVTFRIGLMVPVGSCVSQLSWVWFSQGSRPLYDVVRFIEASRNPYGSFQLLLSHRIRSLAFLGAIVTVLSIVIGPFFQQSLVFYSHPVVDTAADVPFVSYRYGQNKSNGEESFLQVNSPRAGQSPPNINAAVYSGLLSSGVLSLPDPPFSCSSGNCTWDPFPTLALGFHCVDAPELYHLNCSIEDVGLQRCVMIRDHLPVMNAEFSEHETDRDWRTIFHFVEGISKDTYDPKQDPHLWPSYVGWHTNIDWLRATSLQSRRFIYLDDNSVAYEGTPEFASCKENKESDRCKDGEHLHRFITRDSDIESRQCRIYFCLQEISATVRNGIYREEVLQEIADHTDIISDGPSEIVYSYLSTNGAPKNVSIDRASQLAILRTIHNVFHRPLDSALRRSHDNEPTYYGNLRTDVAWYLNGTNLMQTLYTTPNLTGTVHNLVHNMNVALRSVYTFKDIQEAQLNGTRLPKNYISPKERVAGIVLVDRIHVGVRWAWLALPGVLLVLTFTLLVATIMQSRGQKVGIWKENPLALLLSARWEDPDEQGMGYARTEKDIKHAAEGLYAELIRDADVDGEGKGTMLIQRRLGAK